MKQFIKSEVFLFWNKIWYAWLGLCKNWMLILEDKKLKMPIVFNILQNSLNGTISNLKYYCIPMYNYVSSFIVPYPEVTFGTLLPNN